MLIGIDLGTTNTVAALFRANQPEVIPDIQGARLIPSIVSYQDTIQVGPPAKQLCISHSECTVFESKRLIGRAFDDPTVQAEMQRFPFKVVNDNGNTAVQIAKPSSVYKVSMEDVAAEILKRIKLNATEFMKEDISECVITVPAYFTENQKSATIEAGRRAGLKVRKIISEPTAAIFAYMFKYPQIQGRVCVIDIGGGTTDITVADVVKTRVDVKAVGGDSNLGGCDVDQALFLDQLEKLTQEFPSVARYDADKRRKLFARLRSHVCEAKCLLSTSKDVELTIPNVQGEKDFDIEIDQDEFNDICQVFYDNCLSAIEKTFANASIDKSSVQHVLLVGGTTRIPKLQQLIGTLFGQKIHDGYFPEEAVALGAAVFADSISLRSQGLSKIELIEACPHHYGTDVDGGFIDFMIAKNSPLPVTVSKKYTTTVDNQSSLNIGVFQGEKSKPAPMFLLPAGCVGSRRSSSLNYRYLFVIDRSGSMSPIYGRMIRSLSNSFAGAALFDDRVEEIASISALRQTNHRNSTNIVIGLEKCREIILRDYQSLPNKSNLCYRIIFISDGGDNCVSNFQSVFQTTATHTLDSLKGLTCSFEVTSVGVGSGFPTHISTQFKRALRGDESTTSIPPVFQNVCSSNVDDIITSIFEQYWTRASLVTVPSALHSLQPRLLPWETTAPSSVSDSINLIVTDAVKLLPNSMRAIKDGLNSIEETDLIRTFGSWCHVIQEQYLGGIIPVEQIKQNAQHALLAAINIIENNKQMKAQYSSSYSITCQCSSPLKQVIQELRDLCVGGVAHLNDVQLAQRMSVGTITAKRSYTDQNDFGPLVESVLTEFHPLGSADGLLAHFVLKNISRKPVGQVQVDVTFNMNNEGILNVSAKK
ncbi:hypothetical protein GEMRC1_004050 [Eukaryota sp. GEM-RC1]